MRNEVITNEKEKRDFDLEERTARFGARIIRFCQKINETPVTRPLISQLARAGTSVGSNYCEADDAVSKKDFIHKIGLCKKESRESKHWLRMIAVACPNLKSEAKELWQEGKELNLIFNAIIRSSKKQ